MYYHTVFLHCPQSPEIEDVIRLLQLVSGDAEAAEHANPAASHADLPLNSDRPANAVFPLKHHIWDS